MMTKAWIGGCSVILICGLAAALHAQGPALSEEEAVAAIESVGGRIYRTLEGQIDIVVLQGESVTDAHLELLRALPAVRALNLDGSQVTDAGLEQLLNLPSLEEVSVRKTKVSPAAAASLEERHPRIYHVAVSSPGMRLGPLAAGLALLPVGMFGVWLCWTTRKKKAVLSPPLYIRGMAWGILLIVAAVVLSAVALIQAMGFDFRLADLFG